MDLYFFVELLERYVSNVVLLFPILSQDFHAGREVNAHPCKYVRVFSTGNVIGYGASMLFVSTCVLALSWETFNQL